MILENKDIYPHFDHSVFQRFQLVRRRQSLESDIRQHKIFFPELFLQFHHVLVLFLVQSRTAFASCQWIFNFRGLLPVASTVLSASRRLVFRGAGQSRTVRRAQVSAGVLLAIFSVGHRAVPVFP